MSDYRPNDNIKSNSDTIKTDVVQNDEDSQTVIRQDKSGIILLGEVIEILPNSNYRVKLKNGIIVLAYSAGKIRTNHIGITLYDKVDVVVAHCDIANLSNTNTTVNVRLIYRHKS